MAFYYSKKTSLHFFFDGKGHYALRPEYRHAPGASSKRGTHQGTDQSFRLEVEARSHDKLSLFSELRILPQLNGNFMGTTPHMPFTGEEKAQNISHPGYQSLEPHLTQVYAQYATDSFILKAGRRGRDWGLGLFLDSGKNPFSNAMNVYDGVTFTSICRSYRLLVLVLDLISYLKSITLLIQGLKIWYNIP